MHDVQLVSFQSQLPLSNSHHVCFTSSYVSDICLHRTISYGSSYQAGSNVSSLCPSHLQCYSLPLSPLTFFLGSHGRLGAYPAHLRVEQYATSQRTITSAVNVCHRIISVVCLLIFYFSFIMPAKVSRILVSILTYLWT